MKLLLLLSMLTFNGCAAYIKLTENKKVKNYCPKTKFINDTNEKMTERDKRTIKYSKKTCRTRYPDYPCLYKLYKRKKNAYIAICGPQVKPPVKHSLREVLD